MNKNAKLLKEFTKYCKENPDQRFYQALRNWSGVPYLVVIENIPGFISDLLPESIGPVKDTFNWEEKNK